MSMLEELWTCGLSYKDHPVKSGSALERTLCLYTKNQNKLKAMLSEEQAELYQKTMDLRHTFATIALQSGVDIRTVSGMLGHADPGFTLRTYTHVTNPMQVKAAETVGNVLEKSLGLQICNPAQTDEFPSAPVNIIEKRGCSLTRQRQKAEPNYRATTASNEVTVPFNGNEQETNPTRPVGSA